MSKRALILGIGGQDGSFLADILLERGYEVHGLYRRSSVDNLWRIAHCRAKVALYQGDVTDASSILRILHHVNPSEVYNVADQDHIGSSFETPAMSAAITYGGPAAVLDAIRWYDDERNIKVFQPVSATIFGDATPPQNLSTPLNPLSPYACAKAGVLHLCRYHRKVFGMKILCGIMFNHDSIRREGDYLLHSIAKQAIAVCKNKQDSIKLGDLELRVDIGCARQFMESVVELMETSLAGDVPMGTGQSMSIGHLATVAANTVGVKYPVIMQGDFTRPGPRSELVAPYPHCAKDCATADRVVERLVSHYFLEEERCE